METTQMLSDKEGEAMGRPQQEEDPKATPPPPPSYAAHVPPPPQYPQGEAPQHYPPATAPQEAAPRSPYPFPPHQQQPHPPPPPEPGQAHFQPASFPPPPSYAAQAPPPPQYPQGEAPRQYPPATAAHEAVPRSPYPFPPHQQQPHPPPPPQPGQAHFEPAAFPPQEPVQPAACFPPVPEQCYQSPATYPPSGPQQFNQTSTPVAGVPYQKPYVATPAAVYGPGAQFASWSTGLFDCLDDPTNALITLCFPCVTFGQVAEILDNGQTSCATSAMMYAAIALCFGVPCILSCTYRTKLRARYGLMESPAPDCLTHCFCDYCAICQEYRELRNRGLDPAIGWHANTMLQAQQQQATMAPPVNQTMR